MTVGAPLTKTPFLTVATGTSCRVSVRVFLTLSLNWTPPLVSSRIATSATAPGSSVPIFSGFRQDARIDQRRASVRQAEAQRSLAVDQAASEVRSLVENADEALDRARAQRLAVTQANRGFEIASAQYREGLGSQLELTDAEVALRQSEFNYAQAVFDYLVARAELDQATGQVPLVDVEPATEAP